MDFPEIGLQLPGTTESGLITLERFIGSGAFGFVFAGRGEDHSQYAVKFPQTATMTGGDELAAFMNEVRAASQIRHANVLSVLAVSEYPGPGLPYLLLEYADGGTLQDTIDASGEVQLPPGVVIDWSRQLIAGIEAINATMLHRDLKPDNVLFVNRVPKIADFGLSKTVGEPTRSRTFKGGQHVLYMPPEGWQGEKNEIQIDMYSMGIILFQLATLQFPYEIPRLMSDIGSIREMHLCQVPRRISATRPDIPARFSDIVFKLMEKRPQDRFASWQDVRKVLDAIAANELIDIPKRPDLRGILDAIQSKHDDAARVAAEAKAEAAERKTKRLADHYSRDKIVERLVTVIEAFNAESQDHKIAITKTGDDKLVFCIPYGRDAKLEFFEFPKIAFRGETARFGGVVADREGCGFNLLLVRTGEDDVYGSWKVCRIVPSVLGRRRLRSGCGSLGLGPDSMTDLQKALTMMHTLTGRLIDDVEGEFVKQLREFTEPIGD